jgi:hypothetical protein
MAIAEQEKTGPGQGAAAPVEAGKPAAQNPIVPAGASAMATAPKFGGLRGGRKRGDGLVPGTAQAAEADREKDAERKRQERAAAAAAVSASQPLPSNLSLAQSELPATGSSAPAGVVAPSVAPVVPWTAQIVRPFTSELVPVIEAADVNGLLKKADAAGLSKEFVKQIEKDAHWPATAKKTLDVALPECAAQLLNATGISAKHANVIAVGTAVVAILTSRNGIQKRLDKLIKQREEQQQKAVTTRDAASYAGLANSIQQARP